METSVALPSLRSGAESEAAWQPAVWCGETPCRNKLPGAVSDAAGETSRSARSAGQMVRVVQADAVQFIQ